MPNRPAKFKGYKRVSTHRLGEVPGLQYTLDLYVCTAAAASNRSVTVFKANCREVAYITGGDDAAQLLTAAQQWAARQHLTDWRPHYEVTLTASAATAADLATMPQRRVQLLDLSLETRPVAIAPGALGLYARYGDGPTQCASPCCLSEVALRPTGDQYTAECVVPTTTHVGLSNLTAALRTFQYNLARLLAPAADDSYDYAASVTTQFLQRCGRLTPEQILQWLSTGSDPSATIARAGRRVVRLPSQE